MTTLIGTVAPAGIGRLKHASLLESLPEPGRPDTLCELNVIEQVLNVCKSTVVQEAWERGQQLSVRGWVYSLTDVLIRDLQMSVARPDNDNGFFQFFAGSLNLQG
jgi:carbonic anhydrase